MEGTVIGLSGIPVLMEWGAEFLLMFLMLGFNLYHDQSKRVLALKEQAVFLVWLQVCA